VEVQQQQHKQHKSKDCDWNSPVIRRKYFDTCLDDSFKFKNTNILLKMPASLASSF